MGYSAALKENLFPWCPGRNTGISIHEVKHLLPFALAKTLKVESLPASANSVLLGKQDKHAGGAKIQAPQMEDKAEQKEGSSLRDEVILRSYLPFSSCFASGVRILRANGNISPQMIALLKSGVPHRRRRTVWTSLLLCNVFAAKNPDCYLALSQMPIDPTLNRKIVIDLARTFPNHPFFDHEGYTHSTPLPG